MRASEMLTKRKKCYLVIVFTWQSTGFSKETIILLSLLSYYNNNNHYCHYWIVIVTIAIERIKQAKLHLDLVSEFHEHSNNAPRMCKRCDGTVMGNLDAQESQEWRYQTKVTYGKICFFIMLCAIKDTMTLERLWCFRSHFSCAPAAPAKRVSAARTKQTGQHLLWFDVERVGESLECLVTRCGCSKFAICHKSPTALWSPPRRPPT